MSRVTGLAQLRQLEVRLLKAGPELDLNVAEELKKMPPVIAGEIRKQAFTHMPTRHGYGRILSKALDFHAKIFVGKGMTMTVWANGRPRRRDVPRLNQGILRHPTFGRRGKGDWHDQTRGVKRGFVTDGVRRSEGRIVRAVRRGAVDTIQTIVR